MMNIDGGKERKGKKALLPFSDVLLNVHSFIFHWDVTG